MSLEKLKQELMSYGKLAGEKNLTPGISGNMSARYENKILITSSGSANGFLCEDEFSLIDFNGNVIEGNPKPSSEKILHAKFYEMRPDVHYILHMHSPYLCSFAAAGLALDEPVMPENLFYFGQIPLAEYDLPSSQGLVEKTAVYFDRYDAVLMANHGFITGAKTIKDAYLKLELAESYAQVIINTKILGGPALLNEKQVKEIYALRG